VEEATMLKVYMLLFIITLVSLIILFAKYIDVKNKLMISEAQNEKLKNQNDKFKDSTYRFENGHLIINYQPRSKL
jgi:cell division protein FtsB